MADPISDSPSWSEVNTHFEDPTNSPISFNDSDVRELAEKPGTDNPIAFSDFIGKTLEPETYLNIAELDGMGFVYGSDNGGQCYMRFNTNGTTTLLSDYDNNDTLPSRWLLSGGSWSDYTFTLNNHSHRGTVYEPEAGDGDYNAPFQLLADTQNIGDSDTWSAGDITITHNTNPADTVTFFAEVYSDIVRPPGQLNYELNNGDFFLSSEVYDESRVHFQTDGSIYYDTQSGDGDAFPQTWISNMESSEYWQIEIISRTITSGSNSVKTMNALGVYDFPLVLGVEAYPLKNGTVDYEVRIRSTSGGSGSIRFIMGVEHDNLPED